ncbi:MAG: hypothetical protein IKK82_07100 [Kiritimatiellae bacterium]|nr:hypothetical protein [Kiritimatiellia bacterium]
MRHCKILAMTLWLLPLSVTAELLQPEIGLGWTNGWASEWRKNVPGLRVSDSKVKVTENLTKVVRRWTWTGTEPLEQVTLAVRYRVEGDAKALKPFVPGILMYGNPSNKGRMDGRVPVFAGESGEFAIFEEHRLPMPFALLEDVTSGTFAALHTLPSPVCGAKCEDLWWSLGVESFKDGSDIVMLSGPVGYNRRRSVVKATQGAALPYDETYITLLPGQVVEKTFWVETGTATKEAFGFEQALDVSLSLFRPYDAERFEKYNGIVETKRRFALSRWVEGPVSNACGFDMYDPQYKWRHLTIGWCGCAATCGYALPVLDFDSSDWDKAQRSLDFLCDVFMDTVQTDGLFRVTFDMKTGKTMGGDPVSCGQGLYSVLKAIRFVERQGRLDASKWRRFAARVADAMAANILRKDWCEPASTGPGFLVAPLVVASEMFGKPDCLAAAQKLAGAFERKYFGYDAVYWGGTLDASCEDKEGAYAAFQGYLELLRNAVASKDAAAERRYARLAQHAMNMMLTYTMVWDATYPPGRLSDHAFKSTGWTVVSAQNQHLDVFGVLTTPEIWRMGEYLGDERLKRLAAVMYRTCFQLTDASGSLGEQIQQTNFAQQGNTSDVRRLRGGYAERWTVFWLTAHFLNAAAQFKEMGVSL